MRVICCVCKKTKKRSSWEALEIKSEAGLSHGYCPECLKDALAKIDVFDEKRLNKAA